MSSYWGVVAEVVLNAAHTRMRELDLWVGSGDNHTSPVQAVAAADRIFAHADHDFAMKSQMPANLIVASRTPIEMDGRCAWRPSCQALLLFAISLSYSSSHISDDALPRVPGQRLTRCRI